MNTMNHTMNRTMHGNNAITAMNTIVSQGAIGGFRSAQQFGSRTPATSRRNVEQAQPNRSQRLTFGLETVSGGYRYGGEQWRGTQKLTGNRLNFFA